MHVINYEFMFGFVIMFRNKRLGILKHLLIKTFLKILFLQIEFFLQNFTFPQFRCIVTTSHLMSEGLHQFSHPEISVPLLI